MQIYLKIDELSNYEEFILNKFPINSASRVKLSSKHQLVGTLEITTATALLTTNIKIVNNMKVETRSEKTQLCIREEAMVMWVQSNTNLWNQKIALGRV